MKYVLIIPDGAADEPIEELGGVTALEAADTPNMDELARVGRTGTVRTTPAGFGAGSDICCMTLLGFDASTYHTGRAPLEAAALGIEPGPDDWIFRVNLVTTTDEGEMLDHSAGHISDAEARTLITDLGEFWREREPDLVADIRLTPGVSYRNIMVDAGQRDYASLATTPPHEIPGEQWNKHLPRGSASDAITRLMELSAECFDAHPVNAARMEAGLRPASMAWIWGQGTRPTLPRFEDAFGVRACIITAVDLLAGIASCLDIDRLPVPGITGYHDTDYDAKGRYACQALDRYDLVIVHIEAPDEASHQADWQRKVDSISAIDEHVVGPIVKRLRSLGSEEDEDAWRMLILPDHYTLVRTRKHDATPVPFALAGSWIRSVVTGPFSEETARTSDLHIDPGDTLMEYFLYAGLKRPYVRPSS